MEREIERFAAVDEQGRPATIVIREAIILAGTLADPSATIPGSRNARLTDGARLNRIDAETFETLDGRRFRRV